MFDQEAYIKQYYKNHKPTLDAKVVDWQKKHPERIKEYSRRYREIHKEEIAAKRILRQAQSNATSKRKMRDYRQSSIRTFLAKKLSQINKKKLGKKAHDKYKSSLTIEHLLSLWEKQDGRCALTGKRLIYKFGSLYTVSIDRIDSNVGYFQGNVQLVCQGINFAKNKFSNEAFLHFWRYDSEELMEMDYCI